MGFRFIIIDDQGFHLASIKALLRKTGLAEEVWPGGMETFHSWNDVFETIVQLQSKGWDPSSECIILLLDLALGQVPTAFEEGLKEIANFAPNVLELYVRIAYTGYAPNAREGALATFDNIIDKRQIFSAEEDKAQAALRAGITKAIRGWEQRTGRKVVGSDIAPQYLPRDSAGARAAEAALGRSTLSAIISEIVEDGWDDIQAAVLTGGYSGAYVLKIEGRSGGSPRSVICKVAKDRRLLEDELAAWRRALQSYSRFIGLLPPVDANLRSSIETPNLWFIVQSNVPGETLVEALGRITGDENDRKSFRAQLSPTVERLEEYALARTDIEVRPPSSPPQLAPIDIHRFESSFGDLLKLRNQCASRGLISRGEYSDSDATEFLNRVVFAWPDAISGAGLDRVPVYEQHGDLNPRNIILTHNYSPQLIDWARFGAWPLGYDLVRLELQVLLRHMSSLEMGDYFPDEIPGWSAVWGELEEYDGEVGSEFGVNDPGLWLVGNIRRMQKKLCRQCPAGLPSPLCEKIINMNRTFDAIKMCSYQDASPFKRLWFFLLAINCARRAGLLG